jgi:hypothetical protein
MNALELADMAENACCAYQKEIAAMLRQQQAHISQQKVEITALTHYVEGQNRKILDLAFAKVYAERSLEIKDEFNALTDGEITILANKHLHYIECDYESTGIYEFARAVLKEAKG